jgi:hypothetical protein
MATVEIERPEVIEPPAPVEEPNPLDETGEVLLRAAEIVRRGWTQCRRWQAKGVVSPRVSYCIAGALGVATVGDPDVSVEATPMRRPMERLWDHLGRNPIGWNDTPGRTKDEVAEALERAAYGL